MVHSLFFLTGSVRLKCCILNGEKKFSVLKIVSRFFKISLVSKQLFQNLARISQFFFFFTFPASFSIIFPKFSNILTDTFFSAEHGPLVNLRKILENFGVNFGNL